jgi:hypothetical protein
MASGFIWDRKTGEQVGWIQDGTDVYSVATERKFATLRGTDLYSLAGEYLDVHLENLRGDDADLIRQPD